MALPVLALIPIVPIVQDWVRLSDFVAVSENWEGARGFDWVHWEEIDGAITAVYVFPKGPGSKAGLETGDVLFEFENLVLYDVNDFTDAIRRIPPGAVRMYTVERGEELMTFDVRFSRYPTFLYPLSPPLWYGSLWGFTVGAFLHLLALIIVLPLAFRSTSALLSALLILTSTLWVFGNLMRMVLLLLFGPVDVSVGYYAFGFQILTLLSLFGWIAFPALLLQHVITGATKHGTYLGPVQALIWLPPLVFSTAALISVVNRGIGPVTLDVMIGPILFYVCCYIAAATSLNLIVSRLPQDNPAEPDPSGWNQVGSAFVCLIAVLAALVVLDVVPLDQVATDTNAAWSILGVQLISILPVGLVSFATLQYGRVDEVFNRAFTYLLVLGLIFFGVAAGLFWLDPYLHRMNWPPSIAVALYVVLLLVILERLSRLLRPLTRTLFSTDRQRAERRLLRFSDRMRSILDVQTLIDQTVNEVGQALRAQSAQLSILNEEAPTGWTQSTYNPTPPRLPRRVLDLIWPTLGTEGKVWARNPELDESRLAGALSEELIRYGAVLAVPVAGKENPIGLLVLGPKAHRRAVYNLADAELLRSTCSQLALAVDRLKLVEREKVLVRATAEAELVALRSQINPHFLFNTLNTIASLIEEKPEQAEQTVEHLAAIFRHILNTESQPFVALETELQQVRRYLTIEKLRFGERLQVREEIDPDLRSLPVPAFTIQTLVENAVLHGIGKKRKGGLITLSVHKVSDLTAELCVHDTGVGIPHLFNRVSSDPTTASFFGIGLTNVAARLEKLFNRTDLLRLESRPGHGTKACIFIPLASQTIGDGSLASEVYLP